MFQPIPEVVRLADVKIDIADRTVVAFAGNRVSVTVRLTVLRGISIIIEFGGLVKAFRRIPWQKAIQFDVAEYFENRVYIGFGEAAQYQPFALKRRGYSCYRAVAVLTAFLSADNLHTLWQVLLMV